MSDDKVTRLNPVARAILQGLYDPESPIHRLRGLHYILKAIWASVTDHWKTRIKRHDVHESDRDGYSVSYAEVKTPVDRPIAPQEELVVDFPAPANININMMPFVMAQKFHESKLPSNLKHYWDRIIKHCILRREIGKIGYLTIQESRVDKGSCQRRPGIHTESPGVNLLKDSRGVLVPVYLHWGRVFAAPGDEEQTTFWLKLEGGIFMASNVDDSCRVWNCEIERPGVDSLDIVGKHGDVEHLREFLPADNETMTANRIYWMTDRTPHESLPLTEGAYRQYFRLVTSDVSVWFKDHSTINPNGVVPDPKVTRVALGSKFDGICSVLDP